MALSGEAVSKLLNLVPILVSWLIQKDPTDAANILATIGPRRRASKETRYAFSLLLSLPPLTKCTTTMIREVLGEMPHDVWYRVLFVLISNPEAPLVSNKCYEGLVDEEIKETIDSVLDGSIKMSSVDPDILEEIWMVVQRLPFVNFQAFAEICALVRDTSTNVSQISTLMGPKILLPEGFESIEWRSRASIDRFGSNVTGTFGGMSFLSVNIDKHFSRRSKASSLSSNNRRALIGEDEISKAAEVFHFLVLGAEEIFFRMRPSLATRIPAVGFRSRLFRPKNTVKIQKQDRIRQLISFYGLADEKFTPVAERLFDSYSFPQIAEGIWNHYGFLPDQWIGELALFHTEHEKNVENKKHLKWFQENREVLKELNFGNLNSYKQRERTFKILEKEGINRVVEELFCGEFQYFKRLKSFNDCFAVELHEISLGAKGNKPQKKLGLTEQEVRKVFGRRLSGLLDRIETMLVHFEVLRLVRGPVTVDNVESKKTRAGLAAQILLDQGTKLIEAYKQYTETQERCQTILDSSRNKLKFDKKPDEKAMNFMEIWMKKCTSVPDLNGCSIDGLLVAPCKRFTQYTLLLDRMKKELKKEDKNPCATEIGKLDAAIHMCNGISGNMDGAIKTRNKVEKLTGAALNL